MPSSPSSKNSFPITSPIKSLSDFISRDVVAQPSNDLPNKLNTFDSDLDTAQTGTKVWAFRLDRTCAILGGAIPAGVVFGTTVFELVVGLVGILWIIRQVFARTKGLSAVFKNPLVLPWIAFYGCIVISAIANFRNVNELAENILFFRYPLCVIALTDISHRLPVHLYMLKGLIFGVLLALLNTFMAHLVGFDMIGREVARYAGKLKEAGRFSGLAALGGPFLLAWGLSDQQLKHLQRFILIGLGLLSLGLVLQFDIRTVQLGALAGCFAALLIFVARRFTWVWAFVIVILAGCGFVGYIVVKDPYLGSFYDRIHIWKVALAIWQENPSVGVSVTGYRDAYREIITAGPLSRFAVVAPNGVVYDGMVNGTIEITSHAHSLALMLLSSTGLLGLGGFVWLLTAGFVRMLKALSYWRSGLGPWLVAFLVIGVAGYNIYDAWYTTLFVFFTVLIAVSDSDPVENIRSHANRP